MKPGWKTTEFWVTLVAPVIYTILVAVGFDSLASAFAAGLGALGYNISRGMAKGGQQ